MDVHDNEILTYTVDFENKEITMKTINRKREIIFVKFKDVLVHYFEMAMPNSIIFDIDEYEGRKVVKEERELLKNTKAFCWPLAYENENDLIRMINYALQTYLNIPPSVCVSMPLLVPESYEKNRKLSKQLRLCRA